MKAKDFLRKEAEEQAKKIDEKYGESAYGGSKWMSTPSEGADDSFFEQYAQREQNYAQQQAWKQYKLKYLSYDEGTAKKNIDSLQNLYNSAAGLKNYRPMTGQEVGATYGAYTNDIYTGKADEFAKKNGYGSLSELSAKLAEARRDYNTNTNLKKQIQFMDEAENDKDFKSYVKKGKSMQNGLLQETKNGTYLVSDAYEYAEYSKDEADIYYYLSGKYGIAKAKEYLDTALEQARYRSAVRQYGKLQGKPVLEWLSGVDAGFNQAFEGMNAALSDDDYIPQSISQMRSGMVREDLKDVGPEILGSSLGQGVYDLIDNSANMIPSIALSTAVGVVNPVAGSAIGATLMGTSAGGNAYQEMLNAGYSKGQARTYAAINGALEGGLQYLLGGVGKLGGVVTKGAIKNAVEGIDRAGLKFAIKYGSEMASEGLEESLQEILDPIVKNAVLGTDEKIDWEQVAYNGLLGALNAGVLNSGSAISENYAVNGAYKEAFSDNIQDLINESKELNPGNKAVAKAESKLAKGKSVSGNTIRKMAQASSETVAAQNIETLKSAAVTRLTELNETADVDTVAGAVAKQVTGKKLTSKEKTALSESKYGQRVVNELNPYNVGTGEYANSFAETAYDNMSPVDTYSRLLERVQKQTEAERSADTSTYAERTMDASESLEESMPDELVEQSKKYGKQAGAYLHTYNMSTESGDTKVFDSAYNLAYTYGKEGVKYSAIENKEQLNTLTPQQIRAAYDAGKAKRTEENSNGREKISDDSGKRNAGVDTRVEGGSMAEGTGAAESRGYGSTQKERAAKIRAAAQAGKPVSGQDLGVKNATDEANLHIVKPDAVLKSIQNRYPSLHITYVDGDIKLKDGGLARGAIVDGKNVIINAAHPSLSAEQIVKHEYYHSLGKRHNKMLAERAEKLYGPEWCKYMAEAYAESYAGESAEAILDEIFADAYAGIDNLKLRDNVRARATDISDLVTEAVQSDEAATPLRTDEAVGDSGGTKFAIETFEGTNKKYVKADRQVIHGDDPAQWAKQVENYINEKIRKNEDVVFPMEDGHVLLLTGRSAYKLTDRHVSSIAKQVETLLSDEDFALKGSVASHIDELIQVAKFREHREDVDGKHENDIGEDGFNYYDAFFMDADGKYYRVRFSAGVNENQETVYSIGSITERKTPVRGGSSEKNRRSKKDRGLSKDIVYTSEKKSQEVKTAVQLAFEKALGEKTEKHSREFTPEFKKWFGESKAVDKDGNPLVLYRGHKRGSTVYTPDYRGAIWASTNEEYAEKLGKTDKLYASVQNPYEVTVKSSDGSYDIDATIAKAKSDGHDGAIISFVFDTEKAKSSYVEWMAQNAPDRDAQEVLNDYKFSNYMQAKKGETISEFWQRAQEGPIEQHVAAWKSEQFKSTENSKPTSNPDIKLSKEVDEANKQDYKVYNNRALLKEGTVEKYLKDYAASNPKYAQAYITYMDPSTYLKLTTSKQYRDAIYDQSHELNEDELAEANAYQPIQLHYDSEEQRISGHEGRHRMVALERAGVTKVPVLVFDSSNKYSKAPIDSLSVKGQFDETESASLRDMLPFSREYKDEIIKQYAMKSTAEKIHESRGKSTVRFSLDAPIEQTDRLVALHNKSATGVMRMLKRGGVPFPSIAIKKADTAHEGFGEYTVMYPRDTIDPRSSKWNKLYGDDAWTPTEPWVEYEVEDTHNLRKQLEKSLGSDIYHALQASSMLEETNLRDKVQNAEGDVYAALATVPAVKYAYLQSIGKEPKAKTVDDKLDKFYRYNNEQLVAIFNALSNEELQNLQYGDNETNRKIADILNSQFLDTVSNENAKKLFRKKPLWSADGINPNILGDAYRAWQEAGNKIPSVTDGQSLRDELNANKALEKDGTFKKWIKDNFGDIKVNSGLRNNKELFTPSGNRRSFKQLHDEPTLENVVRIMRQEPETGVSMAGTNLVGAATKEYSDVEDMRADSGRLYGTRITDDDYQGRMEVFNGRLHDLEVRAAKGNGWEHMDSARQTLLEVMQSAKTEKSMANKLKKEAQWINIDADLASDLWQLKQDVMNMPAPYFEAKPRRVVYNEEAVAFIIPDNAPSELVAELNKQGLNYLTYKAGDETDRLSKVNEVAEKEPSAKFSKEFEEEGNKKAEAKITSGMSDSERADILRKKTIVAPYYTGQADKTIAAESKNLNSSKRSLVTAALARIGIEFNVFTENGEGYKVPDVEVEVSFSKGALKESAHKAITNSAQLARLMPVLKTAVENAVGLEVHENRYFFDNNTKQFHELLGGYIDGEYFVPVRFGLKEANDGKATLYIVVCQDKIKKTEVMGAHDMDKTSGQYAPRSVTLNVAQIAEKVNTPNLLRYIPDNFLNESQKEKKYKTIAETIEYTTDKNDRKYAEALSEGRLSDAKTYVKAAAKAAGYTIHAYHGTAAEFTVFDKKKIGQNYMQSEGGFFFTDRKRTAENYAANAGGERVIDAYLKMDNPYVVKAPSARHPIEFFDEHRAEILPEAERKGNDGIIVQNENGALYIVFESEQVKSAEPITYDDNGAVIPISKRFDSSNPDMRYSREMNESLLEKQNEALKEQLDYYKGQLKRTTVKTARKSDVNKAARTLLKEYDSKLNKEEFAKMLDSIEHYILNNDELRWSDLKEMSTAAAKALVNNAQVLNDEVWEQYRDLIDYLKDAEIILPKREKADMNNYAAFRRHHQGVMKHLKLGEKGNIDMMWMELGEMFGENLFDPTIYSQADMLTHLGEFLDRIRPEFENPFDYGYDMVVEYAANAIIDELLSENIRQTAPTFADKADAKLKAQKASDKQKLDALRDAKNEQIANTKAKMQADKTDALRELRAEKNAKLKQLRKDMQASKDDALRRLRKQRNARISAIKQSYADSRARARERRADSAARSRLLNIVKRLQNKKLPAATREELDAMIGDIDTVSKSLTGKTVQKLSDLREWYEEHKENDPDFISDPYIEKKIARLSKKHIADMTAQEVADLTNVLLNIENELRTKNKLIDSEERREVYNLAVETMSDIESTKGNGGFGTKAENLFINNTLSPVRFIRKITGYHDSNPLYKATQSLADGQRNMLSYQMHAQKPFEKFAQDKAFNKMFAGAKASEIEIAGLSARGIVKVKITPAMRASLYLHSLNDQNLRHIAEGGITVPDIKLYKKGDIADAYARGTTIKLTPSQVRSIVAKMSAKEKAFAEAAHLYFNSTSKGAINETSEKLKGYSLAQVDNYFPINTDSSFTKKEFDSLKFDGTIEGMGFLKERVNAANPIMLRDANDVVDKSIQMHAKYVGLAIPVRNFSKLLGVNKTSFNDDGSRNSYLSSVQKAIKQKWGEFGYDYIEKMMTDLQGNSAKEMNDWAKMFQKVKSSYAGAVLTLNASVAAKQAASYPTAAAVLGWKPLIQAMGNFGKVDLNTIENYTPLQWYRSQGFSTKELGDLKSADRALPPILNWVQGMDVLTTRKLWKASEYYIQNEGKYKVGSDEYYKAVADIYNRVIEETQPNYTTMQRPQLLRSDDTLMGNLMMFKTQPFQNFNILYDAVENYAAKKKHGNTAEIAEAKRNLNNAVTSQIAQLAVFAGMTFAWAMFRGGKKYKDDDDELTWASFLKAYGKDLMGGLLADVPFGSEAWELMQSYAFGDKYNAPETLVVSAIEDARKGGDALIKAVLETAQNAKDGKPIDYQKLALSVDKAADGISKVFGIPYENVTNLFNACYRWGTIAKQGKYSGEYSALLLTKSKADNKSLYQDVLYKAYDNDLSQYNIVFARMENDGFEPKNMMEKRFKADAKEAVKANDHAAFDDAIKGLVYIGSDADAHKAAQSTIKGMYEDGASEADAKQMLQSYAGLDSDKAQEVVNRWSYKAANEDSNVSAAGIKNYYEYVKPTGITAENYSEWWEEAKSMKGTDLDHDGKTDKGSVAAQQLEYIDSLPVSNSQKRQLAIAFGMKESTVNKYTGW